MVRGSRRIGRGQNRMKIKGCVAVVTGGASGLGLATVHRLAAAGARATVIDLPSSRGAEAAASVNGLFMPADVGSSQEVAAAFAAATEVGVLRVAVNCAGVATAGRVIGKRGVLPLEDF